jgi:hypothetical protein
LSLKRSIRNSQHFWMLERQLSRCIA